MSKIVQPIGKLDSSLSKKALVELAQNHATQILSNPNYDLLRTYIEFKRYELYLKTMINTVKGAALELAKTTDKTNFRYGEANVAIQKRYQYDFSIDQTWMNLDQEIKRLSKLKKQQEEVLKNIRGQFKEVVDTETGEVQYLKAPKKETKEVISIKL